MHFSDEVLEQHERLARFVEVEADRECEFEGAPAEGDGGFDD